MKTPTPGPWLINESNGYDAEFGDENNITTTGDIGQETEICRITKIYEWDEDTQIGLISNDQTEANAILISKVPEMFDIIRRLGVERLEYDCEIRDAQKLYDELENLLKQ